MPASIFEAGDLSYLGSRFFEGVELQSHYNYVVEVEDSRNYDLATVKTDPKERLYDPTYANENDHLERIAKAQVAVKALLQQ